jgi:subtilase family serine protease
LIFCLLVAAAMMCAATAPAAQPSAAGRNVAPWVAKATKIGSAPDGQSVTIAVHMTLKDAASLKALVAAVSSPTSQQYGRYLTSEDFARRFAPAASDIDAVKSLLETAGMSDVKVGPYGVYVSATATVAQLRTVFHVSQVLYDYNGMTLRANKEEPTLPSALAGKIVYVEGLDDSTALRHPLHHSATLGKLVAPAAAADAHTGTSASVTPPPVAANNPSPYCNTHYGSDALVAALSTAAGVYGAAIPWLNCGYTPQQIHAAYGLNKVKYDGGGVTVAIVDAYASPTLLADGNRYSANHDLPNLTPGKNFSQIIPIGIYDVSPSESCGPYGWWTEQSLDVAAVHGAAPGAKIVYVGSRDCNTSLDIALFNTVYNHVADVVTNSWAYNGEQIAPGSQAMYDQALMAGAAQGMTVLFASGDDGDLAAMNGVASGSWPATSAYATGVGGTTLLIDSNGTKSEYGWGTYRDLLADVTVHSAKAVTTSGLATTTAYGVTFDDFAFYAGSGGGISLLESQPTYQASMVPQTLATTLNLASGYTEPLPAAQRVSPDVAMVADPYTGYLYGETFTIAGNRIADHGCTPISKTEEYCEGAIGGTSVASPLMAGVIAIMNQKRIASGEPLVGFANPMLYSNGSHGNGVDLSSGGLNQIVAPSHPVSLLRGYAANLAEARLVTVNSVPFLITTAPYALEVCSLAICEGLDDVFNFTSLSTYGGTPAGYNDVTGLGVPYVPKLIQEE